MYMETIPFSDLSFPCRPFMGVTEKITRGISLLSPWFTTDMKHRALESLSEIADVYSVPFATHFFYKLIGISFSFLGCLKYFGFYQGYWA